MKSRSNPAKWGLTAGLLRIKAVRFPCGRSSHHWNTFRSGKGARLPQFASTSMLKDIVGEQVAVTVWAKSNKKSAGPVARFEMKSDNPKDSIACIVGQPKKHMNLAAGSEKFVEFTSVLDVPTTVTSMRLDLENRSTEDGPSVFFDGAKL